MIYKIPAGVKDAAVAHIADADYYDVLSQLLQEYRQMVWVSMFLVDVSSADENFLKVHRLLLHLKNLEWEGADVKLMVSGSKDNLAIAQVSLAASYFLDAMHLPSKILITKERNPAHMKMVIIDDMVLIGSHNWSPGSFGDQHQDSVLVKSDAYAAYCKLLFSNQWSKY